MQKIIAVDVDGVCADLASTWIEKYNMDYSDNLNVNDIKDWNIHHFVKPICGHKIYEYLEYPELYDMVHPIENSKDGIEYLRQLGFRIIFVTSSTRGASGRKYDWLNEWGFITTLKDYVEAQDKSLILADYMIDDYDVNINLFKGIGILFSQEWNKTSNITPRCNNWIDVCKFFENIKHIKRKG